MYTLTTYPVQIVIQSAATRVYTPNSLPCSKYVPVLTVFTRQRLILFTLCPTLLPHTHAHTHTHTYTHETACLLHILSQSSDVYACGGHYCSLYTPFFNFIHTCMWQLVFFTSGLSVTSSDTNQNVPWLRLLSHRSFTAEARARS